ncbi:MAG: tRNA uridine-5-carboxymethylaminomethyl(34) synthesis GTPase MnmE [Pseudomonadota bacterium]
MDTIFAEATAPGRAGVSIIRVSGPRAFEIVTALTGSLPSPRVTSLRNISVPRGGVIDQALVLIFPKPNSFTGEDVVELHLHGSIAVIKRTLEVLSQFDDTRLAIPGEFTRRAMENQRMDLTQIEGLADLIEAETEAQRRQAARVFAGKLGDVVGGWRQRLTRAAALLEATIDFADEEVPADVTPEVRLLLNQVIEEIEVEHRGSQVAERIRQGFEVAIVGRPNVGKSTLLNALAGRDAAITSSTAGTTRDIIEVRMDLGGLPVTLLDTAGLRESDDEIERLGVERALNRASQADLRVFLAEPDDVLMLEASNDDILVRPKGDLLNDDMNSISGLTGKGVSQLVDRIQQVLADRARSAGLATHERHRAALAISLDRLSEASMALNLGVDYYDQTAESLRSAIRSLEVLIGYIGTEDLLDEIFASFCLGK